MLIHFWHKLNIFFYHSTTIKSSPNNNMTLQKCKLNFTITFVNDYWHFSSVQSLSCVWLFVTPWAAACRVSLSITNSWNLLKLMSIKSVMPSNHLILCCPLPLWPLIFPRIRVFSNKSVLHIRWPKYLSISFSISPSVNIQDWFSLEWTVWISLLSNGLSRVFSNTTVQKPQLFSFQLSL